MPEIVIKYDKIGAGAGGAGVGPAAAIGQEAKSGVTDMLRQITGYAKASMSIAAGAAGGNILGAAGGVGSMAGSAIGTALGGPAGGAIGGAIGGTLASIPQMVVDGLKGMASIVEIFNPAAAQQFFQVMKDITGILGMIFEPILKSATGYLRVFADNFLFIAGPLTKFTKMIAHLADVALPYLIKMYDALARVIGPWIGAGTTRKSSYGMGGVNTSYGGIEEFGKQAHLAFRQASRGAAEQTADNTKDARDFLDHIDKTLASWGEVILSIPKLFEELMPNWLKSA